MTIFGLKIMTVKKYDEDILYAFNEGVKNGWDNCYNTGGCK